MNAALLQLRVSRAETAAQRWLRVEQLLAGLEGQAADLLILPELWGVGFANADRWAHEEEPLYGRTVSRLAPWARRLHCHILTGSFVERTQAGTRCNTSVLLDANGYVLGSYRKIHLFGYGAQERALLTAGTQTSEIFTPFGIAGLATCYDLRFPEQFRRMVDNGASLFLVPAAWPKARLDEWRLFCRTRALENQSFLLACNCGGDGDSAGFAGHSMIAAPDGTVLAEAGDGEELLTVTLDLNEAARFRRQFPALRDRVPL